MSRELVALKGRSPLAMEPATPADVAAWLDEHPELHFAVLGSIRVARTWGFSQGVVTLDHPLTHKAIGAGVRGLDGDPLAWKWWAGPLGDRSEGIAWSAEECRVRIREALEARGWSVL